MTPLTSDATSHLSQLWQGVFVVMALLGTAWSLYLGFRQVRTVRQHREAVPVDFVDTISLTDHQKAADYTVAKWSFARGESLVELALLLALTLGGGIDFLYRFAAVTLPQQVIAQGVLILSALFVTHWLVGLPFAYIRQFSLEARFGFNRMTPRLFWQDTGKQLVLAVLIALPLLAGALFLMRSMGSAWWVYVWGFWLAINLLLFWLYPSVIAPLFNRFTPLTDEAVKAGVEALLTRCGFASKGLFVMDGSKRSSHGNAYFSGFGKARRIVFFDTLLNRLTPKEIEAVLAHELGHFCCHHIIKRLVLMAVLALLAFYGLGLLANAEWFYLGLGVSADPGQPALALALFVLAMPTLTWPFAPLLSIWSRRHEFEADAFAATNSSAEDLIRALVKLYQDNASTLTPDPLVSLVVDSHPPASIRIAQLRRAAVRG